MVNHICLMCKKIFIKKSSYIMHTEHKKKPCLKPEELRAHFCEQLLINNVKSQKNEQKKHIFVNNICKNINMVCEYCNKIFKKNYNLTRHLLTCHVKNNINKEKEIEILKNKNDEIEKLKNENNILKNDVEKLNNSLINLKPIIHINNNNNIHINIVNYGQEDFSKLDIKKILKYDNSFIEMVFRDIHCNRELPEYQNILLPSLSRYEIYIKLNNEWLKRNKKEILKERYLIIRDYIMELYTEESEKNKKKAEEIYYHFLKQIKLVDPTNTIYKPEEEKKIIDGIANVLYNHKNNIKSINKIPIIVNK